MNLGQYIIELILGISIGVLSHLAIKFYESKRNRKNEEPKNKKRRTSWKVYFIAVLIGIAAFFIFRFTIPDKQTSLNEDIKSEQSILDKPIKSIVNDTFKYPDSLFVRVLKNGIPQFFYECYVSRAIGETNIKYPGGTKSAEIPIRTDRPDVSVNCMIEYNGRWLLDMVHDPFKKKGYELEINGKIVPHKYFFELPEIESANYKILINEFFKTR